MGAHGGTWNFSGEPIDQPSLNAFAQALAVYGPDGQEIVTDKGVAIIQCSFHTAPGSQLQKQPHKSDKGLVFTWEGRLDNRDELISKLSKPNTLNPSDVSLVAAAFDTWGTACFERLIGDWAVAIWSPLSRELILARDYIGVKRLFYRRTPSHVTWSTHLPSLVQSSGQYTVSEEYIAGYLSLFADAHLTPYREILSVRPGHFLKISQGTLREQAYYQFNPHRMIRYRTDGEYEEHYRDLFRQAVRRRLRTDTPVLAELSGGFDSSAIVCMADDILAKEGAEPPRIDTFTFLDPGEPGEEDTHYSRKIEQRRGRIGHHVLVQENGVAFSTRIDEFSALPGFFGRNETKGLLPAILDRGNYRVVLSGLGGDELNGQALDFRIEIADLLIQFHWGDAAKRLFAWSLQTRIPFVQLFLQSANLLLPKSFRFKKRSVASSQPWICSDFMRKHRLLDYLMVATEGSWLWRPSVRDAYQTLMSISREMTHEPACREDRRYPYLDQSLTEFLFAIPPTQLLRAGDRRSLMRRALRDILPEELLSRKTKAAAERSISLTLEAQWPAIDAVLHEPLTSSLGITDAARFREALMAAKHGQLSDHVVSLLKALALELWLRDLMRRGIIEAPMRNPRRIPSSTVRLQRRQSAQTAR